MFPVGNANCVYTTLLSLISKINSRWLLIDVLFSFMHTRIEWNDLCVSFIVGSIHALHFFLKQQNKCFDPMIIVSNNINDNNKPIKIYIACVWPMCKT